LERGPSASGGPALFYAVKITNIYRLPQPFVDLVSEDSYNKGEAQYSTTQLIGPPKVSELLRRHGDKLSIDASEKVWTMSGTAKHWILEQIAKRNPARYIAEQRFYMDVDGIKVGGQIDLFDKQTECLHDFKETSVWKAMSDDRFEWIAQGSINKLLCEMNGINPKKVSNILIMKDWKMRESKYKQDYPPCAVKEVELDFWGPEETLAYIKSRIAAHEGAKNTTNDDEIQHCTEKERWRKDDSYAVLKDKKAKRAVPNGIHEDRRSAETHAQKIGGVVEERLGEDIRCQNYCKCRSYCNYGRTLKTEE
jgi:hypothetical protein